MNDMLKNGGPAFPLYIHGEHDQGMTLRDWFAGQAISGSVAYANFHKSDEAQTVADYAYRVADIMLKIREEVAP